MKEVEEKLLKKAKEIKNILAKYGHGSDYFSLTISRSGIICFNNNYWETEEKIDYIDLNELSKLGAKHE